MNILLISLVLIVAVKGNIFDIQKLNESRSDVNNLTECQRDFMFLQESFNFKEKWAIQVIDSWGGVPSGRFHGNLIDYGHFDQCTTNNGVLSLRYCLVPLQDKHNEFPTFKSAFCLPNTCNTSKIVQEMVSKMITSFHYKISGNISCMDGVKTIKEYGAFEYITLAMCCAILLLATLSTGYHVYKRFIQDETKQQPSKQIYTSFSVVQNIQTLFDGKQQDGLLESLNGIRVLSNILIVIMHIDFYLTQSVLSIYNQNEYSDAKFTFWRLAFQQAQLGVDTFLVISGLCLSYGFMKSQQREVKFELLRFYRRRLFRILPTMVVGIVIYVWVEKHQAGPVFDEAFWANKPGNCKKNWWSALLFIQNYVAPTEVCLAPTWSLCVDMQLYLISPIFLFGLWKFSYEFFAFCLAVIGTSCYYVFLVVKELRLNIFNTSLKHFERIYFKTHARLGPWLIGLMLGYILHQQPSFKLYAFGRKLNMKLIHVFIEWIIIVPSILGAFIVPSIFKYFDENVQLAALVIPAHRIAWSLIVAGLIFSNSKNTGNSLDWFLSLKMWKPLVNLSYSSYLIHVSFITLLAKSLRQELYINNFLNIFYGLGVYLMSILVAIPINLLIETPFINIEKYFFNNNNNMQQHEQKND